MEYAVLPEIPEPAPASGYAAARRAALCPRGAARNHLANCGPPGEDGSELGEAIVDPELWQDREGVAGRRQPRLRPEDLVVR